MSLNAAFTKAALDHFSGLMNYENGILRLNKSSDYRLYVDASTSVKSDSSVEEHANCALTVYFKDEFNEHNTTTKIFIMGPITRVEFNVDETIIHCGKLALDTRQS
jgi:hypothetical protein